MTRRYPPVVLVLLIVMLMGLGITLFFDKLKLHVTLNAINGPVLDPIFVYLNYLAEVPGIVAGLMLALYTGRKHFAAMALALILSLAAVSLGKQVLFEEWHRPYYYFSDQQVIQWVEGVSMNQHNAFPSGHSTTIFAICMSLVLAFEKKWVRFLLISLAVLVAFGRVYLSQHFLMDIFAGGVLGTSMAILGNEIVFRIERSRAV